MSTRGQWPEDVGVIMAVVLDVHVIIVVVIDLGPRAIDILSIVDEVVLQNAIVRVPQ